MKDSVSSPTLDQWRTLSPILDKALELEGEDRLKWIHSQDPELARELESMLREHRFLAEAGFLENTIVEVPPTDATLAGQTLGVYKLVSEIGQGGMGSVWLAERSDGRFERQVAVKFLNLALMGKAGEERFKREEKFLHFLPTRISQISSMRALRAPVSPILFLNTSMAIKLIAIAARIR